MKNKVVVFDVKTMLDFLERKFRDLKEKPLKMMKTLSVLNSPPREFSLARENSL
jgi:hypothetical protein